MIGEIEIDKGQSTSLNKGDLVSKWREHGQGLEVFIVHTICSAKEKTGRTYGVAAVVQRLDEVGMA